MYIDRRDIYVQHLKSVGWSIESILSFGLSMSSTNNKVRDSLNSKQNPKELQHRNKETKAGRSKESQTRKSYNLFSI